MSVGILGTSARSAVLLAIDGFSADFPVELNFDLPGMSGIDATRRILKEFPKMPIIKKLGTVKDGGQDLSAIVGTPDQCQASK